MSCHRVANDRKDFCLAGRRTALPQGGPCEGMRLVDSLLFTTNPAPTRGSTSPDYLLGMPFENEFLSL
jgi:hypothetical protein